MTASKRTISGLGSAATLPVAPGRTASSKATRTGRRGGPVAVLAEVLLTLGAILGVVITGITVTAARTGLRPLVVRSGSMEPTIQTGAMVLVRKVDASAIEVGDILAVERPDHTRVTHRVVAVEVTGSVAELTMKGDANEDPDPVPVSVRHAYRVAWHVPTVGRAAAWLATAQGGFVLGCITTASLLRGTGRRGRHERRSRSSSRAASHS